MRHPTRVRPGPISSLPIGRFARLAVLLALLAGCATWPEPPPPVTVQQIVAWSHEGVPASVIIARIRDSGTVYRLEASQLADLRGQGVPDPVINYMQRTYLEAVRRNQFLEDTDSWALYRGYWYGGWPWGWPDAWSPYYPHFHPGYLDRDRERDSDRDRNRGGRRG